jgi:NAD-dependent SIR2 family protein deacetylase
LCVPLPAPTDVPAESGVSTFRDGDGLWKRFRVEELATPE